MRTPKYRPLPLARRDELIVKDCEDEVLVYDKTRDKAHCLNPLAAAIWRACDGETTPGEIAIALKPVHGAHIDQHVVWLGLEELRRSRLLDLSSETPWPQTTGISRRAAIRSIGLGAAITLPIVASLAVPTAVEAATSCKARCNPCTTGECCSGVCGNSTTTGCPGSGNKCL